MHVVDSNQHQSKIRIRDRSPEKLLIRAGNDLDVVVTSREDGTVTVSMHHGKLTLEKTFEPITVLA